LFFYFIIIIIKDEDGCNESNWCVIPLTPFTVSLRTEPRGGHVSGTQRPRRLVMDTFDGSLPQLPFSLSLLSLSLNNSGQLLSDSGTPCQTFPTTLFLF
jgi:hypothetical protein